MNHTEAKTDNPKTAIIVDSCCDVPQDVIKELGFFELPVHIMYDKEDYLDGITIEAKTIYDRFPEEIPTTSMPSFAEIDDVFTEIENKGYENVIAICMSDHLSNTIQNVHTVANEHEKLRTFIFNTKNISVGSGIFGIWAARKLRDGWTFEQITEGLEKKRYDSHLLFYMDTLKYLHKGGRIGNVSYLIGSTLGIRPIISCDHDGVYYTPAKIRGRKNSKSKILDMLKTDKPCWIIMAEGYAPGELTLLNDMVREAMPQAEILFTKQINPSLAVHTGPGLLGMVVLENP
ncbi:MAG: DegV family protein [Eubacterium sp.]|nr:DegV family protein [Eubacterium sp.]